MLDAAYESIAVATLWEMRLLWTRPRRWSVLDPCLPWLVIWYQGWVNIRVFKNKTQTDVREIDLNALGGIWWQWHIYIMAMLCKVWGSFYWSHYYLNCAVFLPLAEVSGRRTNVRIARHASKSCCAVSLLYAWWGETSLRGTSQGRSHFWSFFFVSMKPLHTFGPHGGRLLNLACLSGWADDLNALAIWDMWREGRGAPPITFQGHMHTSDPRIKRSEDLAERPTNQAW